MLGYGVTLRLCRCLKEVHRELVMICPNPFMQNGRIAPSRSMGHTLETHSHRLYNFLRSPKTTFLTEDGYLARKNLQCPRMLSSAGAYCLSTHVSS